MGCSEGAITAACSTKQSFCALGKLTVKQNSSISASIGNVNDFTSVKDWDKIKKVLSNINKYGARGTRNPATTDIDSLPMIMKEDFTYLEIYNNIIKILKTGKNNINKPNGVLLNTNEFLTKQLMQNLLKYIYSYKLNEDRCDTCNTLCNTNCQASAQGGGGGGGGGDGSCELLTYCGQCVLTPTQISNRSADCAMGSGFYPSSGSL